MNIDYLNKFEKAKNLGLKAKAKSNIRMFIDSFTNDEEKSHWVKTYLEKGDYGHKIRHELYEEIVFPVLLNGYHINDSWSLYWLAKTIQNLYQSEKLHRQIDFKTDSELLRACFSSDQTNHSVRLALLSRIVNSLDYAVHEWPAGVCYAPEESPEDLLKEIDYARILDIEKNYTEFFAIVEAIVNEDKARMA